MRSSEDAESPQDSLLARAGRGLARLASIARRRPSARTERFMLIVAFAVFVGLAVGAIWNFPGERQQIRWYLLLAGGLLGVPPTLLLNAVEFQVIAGFVERRIRFREALKVTVLGSAANLLPVPGSTMVRVQVLAQRDVSYGKAVTASIAVGITSLGVHLVLAGLAQAASGPVVAAALVGSGALLVVLVLGLIITTFDRAVATRMTFRALIVEGLYASVASIRLWVILLGLGFDVSVASAFALTATGAVATAVGVFPAGLGIREAMVGAVSPLVGIPIAVGVMGAFVERAFGLLLLASAAAWLALRGRGTAVRSVGGQVGSDTDPDT